MFVKKEDKKILLAAMRVINFYSQEIFRSARRSQPFLPLSLASYLHFISATPLFRDKEIRNQSQGENPPERSIMTTVITQSGNPRLAKSCKKVGVEDIRYASLDTLLGTAKEVVTGIAGSSNIFDPEAEERLPKFEEKEIVAGNILGRGGFCVVREVEKIKPGGINVNPNKKPSKNMKGRFSLRMMRKKVKGGNDDFDVSDYPTIEDLKCPRESVASKSKKSRSKGSRFVMKTVSTDSDKITFMKAHVDMALEAKFLSVLEHPNIIELAGVSGSGFCQQGYFLILERMTETLTRRIKSWMDRERMLKGVTGIFTGGKKKLHELYLERIGASYDIASGMYHLHSKNIIYRDLVSPFKQIKQLISSFSEG